MIDYRIGLVDYIKKVLGKTYPVFDGAMTFEQNPDNYISYFIVNEDTKSLKNYSMPIFDSVQNKFIQDHNPLKQVNILIDVRGTNSFVNARTLHNSFYVPNQLILLDDHGIGFINVSGISSIPHLKNDYQEEGYTFTLTISYDARFITEIEVIKEVKLMHAYSTKCKGNT